MNIHHWQLLFAIPSTIDGGVSILPLISSAEGESTLSQSQSQSSNKLGKAVQTMRASQPLLLAVGMGFVAVWTDVLCFSRA